MSTPTSAVLCSCGCGEVTNAVLIEAERLVHENGETWTRAAEKQGVSYAYLKAIRRQAPKRKKGHNHTPAAQRRSCLICGCPFFSSHPSNRVCSSGFCRIARWRQRMAERAERMAEHTRQMRARSGPLYEAQMRRLDRIDAFLAERNMLSLDAPIRGTFGQDSLTVGETRRFTPGSDDPVFDEVLVLDTPDRNDLFRLARCAAIIPEDFYRRCVEGDLRLVVDDDGVRFVQLRKGPRDLIPRFDPGTAIPSQLSGSTGKKSSRHRGRNSRSAAARGKRSSRSQPKVDR